MTPNYAEDGHLLSLLIHLFHAEFCPANNVGDEKKHTIIPVKFFDWLGEKVGGKEFAWVEDQKGLSPIDGYKACEAAGVPEETWSRMLELVESGYAPEKVGTLWPAIALGARPMPKNRLKRITVTGLLTFEDGTIVPMQNVTTVEMLDGDGFHDSTVAMQVLRACRHISETIGEKGIDGVYALGTNFGGETPFEILMGAMLQVVPQLQPEARAGAQGYMRLCQMLLRPPIAPQHMAQIEARKREMANPGKAMGGWDVG